MTTWCGAPGTKKGGFKTKKGALLRCLESMHSSAAERATLFCSSVSEDDLTVDKVDSAKVALRLKPVGLLWIAGITTRQNLSEQLQARQFNVVGMGWCGPALRVNGNGGNFYE